MLYKLIDRPIYVPYDKYKILIDKIVDELSKDINVLSIFQVGSIKNPGISDLDLFCIFKNGSKNVIDYRTNLSSIEKQILTHNIFILEKKYLNQWLSYNHLSNYNYLYGQENLFNHKKIVELSDDMKTQIALEYLIKMHINLHTQMTYGIIKLRTFLLEAKAIMFDLQLLGINGGRLYDKVKEVIYIRNDWYHLKLDDSKICLLIDKFSMMLNELLNELLVDKVFYLPFPKFKISRNINIAHGDGLLSRHRGIVFPLFFYFLGKKYVNLQNRFNKFNYYIRFTIPEYENIMAKRFNFNEEIYLNNIKNFPFFISPVSSLRIFFSRS